MSEEQTKPAKKWYQSWLPYLLIIVVLLCVAGVCVMGARGHVDISKEGAYETAKIELQNAVKDYQNKNNGKLPTINGTVTINGSDYRIINICSLLTQNEEKLRTLLDSTWSGNESNDDNCDGDCAECTAYGSYIWAVDDQGNVYSTCIGEDCEANGENGYQGVFP